MSKVGNQIKTMLQMMDEGCRRITQTTPSGYCSAAGIILDRGCEMRVSRQRPPAMGKIKECFMNAQRLAIFDPQHYRYAEGWAIDDGLPIPILHAWCVNRLGLVVDPTWHGRPGRHYYGAVIDIDYVLERQLATGVFHAMIDDWEYGSQLLRTPGLVRKVVKKCRRARKK
jgi:hypothetical protein